MRKVVIIIIFSVIFLTVGLALFTLWANWRVSYKTKSFIYDNIEDVKGCNVGLLLGAARYLGSGSKNAYFFNRIDAAVKLFEYGKINYILVSGDNSREDYDESSAMKEELMKRGIPEDRIFLDYAGFRTLDSVLRAKEVFGQNSFIVISQKFHNERAVFLARKYGIDAYGYNAKDVYNNGSITEIREIFARDKLFFDLLFNVGPKFYGDKIYIPNN